MPVESVFPKLSKRVPVKNADWVTQLKRRITAEIEDNHEIAPKF